MSCLHLALLLLFLSAVAISAPVPKPHLKKFENFGTVVEIQGATCEMARPGELRVIVSKDTALESKSHEAARPFVNRTVEADFELTVRITHTPPETEDLAAVGKGEPIASAGIALYKPDAKRGSLVILSRLSKGDDAWDNYFKMSAIDETKEMQGAIGNHSPHQKYTNTPIYLRLTHRGDEFTATQCEDKKGWSPIFESSHEVPGLNAGAKYGSRRPRDGA